MRNLLGVIASLFLCSCAIKTTVPVDILIVNGKVYDGTDSESKTLDIGICGDVICVVSPSGKQQYAAEKTIDAAGMIVSPGFIDPHTHTFLELRSNDKHHNLNYLYQGVTTVVNGNDGGGPPHIPFAVSQLNSDGIGTNVAFFTGHGSIRRLVMGLAERQATEPELLEMEKLVEDAMKAGALGLSSGLYYIPGQFADTQEVIRLAAVSARYGGIYDTHLRDESTFNIGFISALDEAIQIAEEANIHLHLAHIKALGVDVWGQSEQAIAAVENAQSRGVSISADQYPWMASGTNIRSAIIPQWVRADSEEAFMARIHDDTLIDQILEEITENIRRRGGPSKLLITASDETAWVGKTLEDVANIMALTPAQTAIEMVQVSRPHRLASYNMSVNDIERFMQQDWVVTSSDGTNGHPRKYASFPKKYREYVNEKQLITERRFIYSSTGQTADIFNLHDRGKLAVGKKADVIVFDPNTFADNATFQTWNKLSSGMHYVLVNGQLTIENTEFTGALAGQFVKKSEAPK